MSVRGSVPQLGTSRFGLALLRDRLLLPPLLVRVVDDEFNLGRGDEGGVRVRSRLEAESAHFGVGPWLCTRPELSMR